MNSVLWSDYTTYELKETIEKENPIVILNVAATEQHGPHLPLNTDTDIGFNIAKRIAKESPIKAFVLPPVWAGFSPHHMDFTGTITLRQSTLFSVTYDILECVIKHGVTRILLLNSHGGNIALLKTVVDEIGLKLGISPVYVTYWNLISGVINQIRESEMSGMSHACELETSLKMVISPDDLRESLIKDVVVEGNAFHGVDMFSPNKIGIFKTFKEWTETGQIGAPSLASVEKGEKILNAVVKEFKELIVTQWGDSNENN